MWHQRRRAGRRRGSGGDAPIEYAARRVGVGWESRDRITLYGKECRCCQRNWPSGVAAKRIGTTKRRGLEFRGRCRGWRCLLGQGLIRGLWRRRTGGPYAIDAAEALIGTSLAIVVLVGNLIVGAQQPNAVARVVE